MKTLKRLICFAVLAVICATMFGCEDFKAKDYTPTADSFFEFTLNTSGDGYVVSAKSIDNLPETLYLPVEHNGKPVTEVATEGFSAALIKDLRVPANIKTVGNRAFELCTSLEKVYFYKGATEIKDAAFYGCSALQSLTLPKSLKTIGGSAFCECAALKSIELPESLTSIGDFAFAACVSLKHVDIPHAVSYVGGNSFKNCSDDISFTISASNPYLKLDENGYPEVIG